MSAQPVKKRLKPPKGGAPINPNQPAQPVTPTVSQPPIQPQPTAQPTPQAPIQYPSATATTPTTPPQQTPMQPQVAAYPAQSTQPIIQPQQYQPPQPQLIQPQVTQPPKTTEKKTKKTKPPTKTQQKKAPLKIKEYRYLIRVAKGSFLPILFFVLGLRMLQIYVLEYPDTYQYNFVMILAGFLYGFGLTFGITISNLSRAKNRTAGAKLNINIGLVGFLIFLIIILFLAFFVGLSTMFQFSIGFFIAAVFPVILILTFEVMYKGKFFVIEDDGTPDVGRKLIFLPS
jgi:hypothetical protein